jgi:hypothetical protein
MKPMSRSTALVRLDKIRADLRSEISDYERRAKDCRACATPGACCLDAHFVNVHISRLEAVAIGNALARMPRDLRCRVEARIDNSISEYGLSAEGDTFSRTYACPLFEKGVGCVVHTTSKPVPCIVHACYENRADLPPDELQAAAERRIDDLNTRVYGRPQPLLPLPLAIKQHGRGDAG